MTKYPNFDFIPVVPLRNTVLFPGAALPLRVGRSQSVAAIERAKKGDGWFLAVSQKHETADDQVPAGEQLYRVGTLTKIEKIRGNAEDGYQVIARGVARFRITEWNEKGSLLLARAIEEFDIDDPEPKVKEALIESLKSLGVQILEMLSGDNSQIATMLKGIEDLGYLTNLIAGNLDSPVETRQGLLENVHVRSRALALLELLQQRKENLELQTQIREKMSHRLGKNQREMILREQLKTIREELGESGDAKSGDSLRKKIDGADLPADVRKVAMDEFERLEAAGPSSPESHVIRNYIDWLCAMPWNKSSPEGIDLKAAREVLEADHFGLDKVKKRILQHLAVLKLRKDAKGSILCLVGPPGVGKTSLGQSIAKALGRKFVRGSLGGVRDDAEIRGHRRTYIGALPGRIVQGIKRAGENNPVFMLDEIDKLARSFQGDPASALLEVLDPEQNKTFLDHYLDVPFDLSHVFFVATANTLDSIPAPLLDRMEVIEVAGYTTAEKLHIAKNHLLPKQIAEHGLDPGQLKISDEALIKIATHYTREAGVRDLQRKIASVCRAASEKVVSDETTILEATKPKVIEIGVDDLSEILGPERFTHEVVEQGSPPGVATGLAWTPQGGEILYIEAGAMPGTGRLTLTGQLGDVMKESAQIALSLVRAKLPEVAPGFEFDKKDVHIHVPSGAIPKDGPSAGVAILTAVASLFTGRRVPPGLAMTGEITLRGAVMPVGGIKEKVIAAHRAGVRRIILSKKNQKDLIDVPEEVRAELRFDFVETTAEVLKLALDIQSEGITIPSPGVPPQHNAAIA